METIKNRPRKGRGGIERGRGVRECKRRIKSKGIAEREWNEEPGKEMRRGRGKEDQIKNKIQRKREGKGKKEEKRAGREQKEEGWEERKGRARERNERGRKRR